MNTNYLTLISKSKNLTLTNKTTNKITKFTNKKSNKTVNKKDNNLLITVFIGILAFTTNSYAAEGEPCGAVLCLSGISALGGNLGECKPHVRKFFSFNAFSKKGLFNPNAAYVKRYQWLNKCKETNPAFKQAIMQAYGYMPRSPW